MKTTKVAEYILEKEFWVNPYGFGQLMELYI
jgi:hypothetical protein